MASCLVSDFIYCYSDCHYDDCHNDDCHYDDCHYDDCHYDDCRYAECRGDLLCCPSATEHLEKCKQLLEYKHNLLLKDLWWSKT